MHNRRQTAAPHWDADLFAAEVLLIVRQIPRGKVAAYGQIARLAGFPGYARAAGRLLSTQPAASELPCHRVVNAAGQTVPGWHGQRSLLEAEGVAFRRCGKVDLRSALWEP